MALSKCGYCKMTSFEIKEVSPQGGRYKQMFVQCAHCGVPVGVLEYYNTGSQIEKMSLNADKMHQEITTAVDRLANELRQIKLKLNI